MSLNHDAFALLDAAHDLTESLRFKHNLLVSITVLVQVESGDRVLSYLLELVSLSFQIMLF